MHHELPTTVPLTQNIIGNTFMACRCVLLVAHTATRWRGAEQYFILFLGGEMKYVSTSVPKVAPAVGLRRKNIAVLHWEGIYDE